MYDSLINQHYYFNPINSADSTGGITTTGINTISTVEQHYIMDSDQIMNNKSNNNTMTCSCSYTSASSNDTIMIRKRKKNNIENGMKTVQVQRPAKLSKRPIINSQGYRNGTVDQNSDDAEISIQSNRRSRSSKYRGVTRHRWTGRYEAHLWDKESWNVSHSKKGKQVYLGAYDDEEVAARAYDLAALKYWGSKTMLNFPLTTYSNEIEEMKRTTREEYVASLRRNSNGFSRGVSKYRGVARHHHNGRWEARIGRVFGNKYLYLGTYSTEEEAAIAYDIAAIEHRGVHAVTNFDISNYVTLLSSKLKPHLMNMNIDNNIHSSYALHDYLELGSHYHVKSIWYRDMIAQLNAYGSNAIHDEASVLGAAPSQHFDVQNQVPQIDYAMDSLKSSLYDSTNDFSSEGIGQRFSTYKEIKNNIEYVGKHQNLCHTHIHLKDEHEPNILHQLQCEGLINGSVQLQGLGEMLSDTSTSSSSTMATNQVVNNDENEEFITRTIGPIHTITCDEYMTHVMQPMLHTSCLFDVPSNLIYSSICSSNNLTPSENVVLPEVPNNYGDLMVTNNFNHDVSTLPPLNMQQSFC